MDKQKAIATAKELFKHYPSVTHFYVTKDGQAFEQRTDADSHASFLDKKNPQVFEVEKSETEKPGKQAVNAVEAATAKVQSLTEKLAKAASKDKAKAQKALDAANDELAEAEKAAADQA